MTNKEVYNKTLTFSLHRLLIDVLSVVLLAALAGGGFLLLEKTTGKGLIGLAIGLVIGLVVLFFLLRYVSYTYKAGQIAMMTKGVTEGELPEDVLGAGKAVVKERFLTVAAFFAITRAIKAIFNQLSKGLSAVGRAVGGDAGSSAADVVNSVIQVVISYLSDCCLGWVFYRKEQKSAKAACEGAVIFFKHGKTLAKNMGRVFGIGLVSLVLIGGVFFGIFYLIFTNIPQMSKVFEVVAREFAQSSDAKVRFLSDPNSVLIATAALAGFIIWAILHSVFIRPFVLVGVLRNYMESGMNDIPTEESFSVLDKKSAKFAKLHGEADAA